MVDAFAASRPWVTVIHQANSGGPGAPRNAGLDRARGRYVFFLDADDYLGVEALERLVAMAERNTSDIVLGRMVGIEGRVRGRSALFADNHDRVPVEVVFRSGNVLKLFRRSLIEQAGLRFQPGVAGGEDGDFMARAYLRAGTISIVGDYACYFARRRPGSQTSRADRKDDLVEYFARLEANRIEPVVASRRAGVRRDMLLSKPLGKLAGKFWHAWPHRDPDERRRVFDAGSEVARRWHTPGVDRWLPHRSRLALHCLTHGKLAELEAITARPARLAYQSPVVEGRHVFVPLPHFRDGTGIPDRCYEITDEIQPYVKLQRAALAAGRLEVEGQAYVRLLGGRTTIELRRRPFGPRLRWPTERVRTPGLRDKHAEYPRAGFALSVDIGSDHGGLPDGTWTVRALIDAGAIHRSAVPRLPAHGARAARHRQMKLDGRAQLRRGPGRSLRLLVGRDPAAGLLDRVESGIVKSSRAIDRVKRVARYALLGRRR
jgi:CDP-glycerol glycerophosphotransferase